MSDIPYSLGPNNPMPTPKTRYTIYWFDDKNQRCSYKFASTLEKCRIIVGTTQVAGAVRVRVCDNAYPFGEYDVQWNNLDMLEFRNKYIVCMDCKE